MVSEAGENDATHGANSGHTGADAVSHHATEEAERLDEIPVKLTLGGATLSFGASGQWELEHSALQEYIERSQALSARVETLEKENAQLREKQARMLEESNMEKFKCQLLIEMLAISSLDEERSKLEADKEKAKAVSLRNDMLTLMEQARKEGIDIQKLASIFPLSPSNNKTAP